jgi:hypothetical protein
MRNYILEYGEIKPCDDIIEWARWMDKHDRNIARDIIKTDVGQIMVSTVFLGMDHSFAEGPPILFETMIFGGKHDQYQERCSTLDEAKIMHEEAVKLVEGN